MLLTLPFKVPLSRSVTTRFDGPIMQSLSDGVSHLAETANRGLAKLANQLSELMGFFKLEGRVLSQPANTRSVKSKLGAGSHPVTAPKGDGW